MGIHNLVAGADACTYWGLTVCLVLLAGTAVPAATLHSSSQSPTAPLTSSSQCAACHPREHAQWAGSRHARALSPGVVGQLEAFDDATVRMCLRCHAPIAAEAEEIATGRPMNSDEAVGCLACHLWEGKIIGPRNLAETPHGPVIGDERFRQAEFCAPCHQFEPGDVSVNGKPLENTLEEWRSSRYGELGVTCQACHMAAGYHGFRGIHDPAAVRRALSIVVKRTATGVHITIANVGAGHAVPTYITPRLTVRVTSPSGKLLRSWTFQRAMAWSPATGWEERFDTRLMPDETHVLQAPLPSELSARVQFFVAPDADYHDRVYPYLIRELHGELGHQSIRLLETALKESARSEYQLLQWHCGPAGGQDHDCR